ncbi:MAG: thioredoxin domain-containing protein [Alphaproteobacteria bacterium]|jgi:protein-disulfide isomerase|nr:thioredoxin domain-containing protein [Alphaproteobacteria bacterium]
MKINKILLLIFLICGSLNAESINYKGFIKDEIPLIKSNNPNAVDIIEFSSFTCSHCRDFHTITLPEIKQSEIIDDINYYIIDFPLDYFAFYASRIGSCIGDNRSTFTDIVYDQQDTWKKIYKSSEPESQFELENTLMNYALQLGHSESKLLQCIKNEDMQNKLLAKQMEAQKKYKVESTPTFLINDEKIMGNQPAVKFIDIIKKKLKE